MEEKTYPCPWCDREVPIGPDGCPICAEKKRLRKRRAEVLPLSKGKASLRVGGRDSGPKARSEEEPDEEPWWSDEFSEDAPHVKNRIKWYWWVVAVLLVIVMLKQLYPPLRIF